MKMILRSSMLIALLASALSLSAQSVTTPPTPPGGTNPAAIPADEGALIIDSLPATTIAFEHDTYDFGKIKQGEVVKHSFVFTNTGPNPLYIDNVKPTCGCTAVDWTKEAVAPGGKGKIDAQFNSAGKMGQQLKHITIVYNGEVRIVRVTFTGEVMPVEQAPVPAEKIIDKPTPIPPGQ